MPVSGHYKIKVVRDRIYKKEYAPELLSIAQADLKTAEVLSTSKEVRQENTLFHVGQAVEKALKAVLCFQEKPVPLTHDIEAVLQHFSEKQLPPDALALSDLTPFATVRRYEEGNAVVSAEEVASALKVGRGVIAWAWEILKP